MIDLMLFAGRIVLVILLFLFLLAVMRLPKIGRASCRERV